MKTSFTRGCAPTACGLPPSFGETRFFGRSPKNVAASAGPIICRQRFLALDSFRQGLRPWDLGPGAWGV